MWQERATATVRPTRSTRAGQRLLQPHEGRQDNAPGNGDQSLTNQREAPQAAQCTAYRGVRRPACPLERTGHWPCSGANGFHGLKGAPQVRPEVRSAMAQDRPPVRTWEAGVIRVHRYLGARPGPLAGSPVPPAPARGFPCHVAKDWQILTLALVAVVVLLAAALLAWLVVWLVNRSHRRSSAPPPTYERHLAGLFRLLVALEAHTTLSRRPAASDS